MTRIGIIRQAYAAEVEPRPYSRFTQNEVERLYNDRWAIRAELWGARNFTETGHRMFLS